MSIFLELEKDLWDLIVLRKKKKNIEPYRVSLMIAVVVDITIIIMFDIKKELHDIVEVSPAIWFDGFILGSKFWLGESELQQGVWVPGESWWSSHNVLQVQQVPVLLLHALQARWDIWLSESEGELANLHFR